MKTKWQWIAILPFCLSTSASGGAIEFSVAGSYSRSNYTESNYSWNRRYGGSIGYHLSERSQIEFAFQDSLDRTRIAYYEDTTFHDQVYSANWVQALTGKNFAIQPYFKIGIGQLNREASGNYVFGSSPPAVVDSVTGVLGLGSRIYLTRSFGLRAEATSYLQGGSIRTWKDNFGITVGVSFFF